MSDSISPDDIDGVGPKGFFRSVALKQVEPNSSGDVRLLQQAPAWGLHLLLRANGIKYTTENVLFPFAIGHRLPVLIRGNVFYTEGAVLLSNASLVDEIQVDKDAMIASYISSIRDLSVAIAEIDDQGQRRQCGVVRALGSRMLEWYHDGVGGARHVPTFYQGWSEKRIIHHLAQVYAYLDSVLAENMNLTLGNSETPRAADAILFAHVLEARNIPKISDLVRSYSSVNKAVFFLLQKYFSSDEYGDLNGGLLKNACARLDSEVFATLSKAKVNLSNIPTSKQVFCADKNCEAASARCQQSTFLLDFSIQNFIPWRSQGYEPMNGNLSVIFNLRSALFTSVVASSFFVYLLKAYQS